MATKTFCELSGVTGLPENVLGLLKEVYRHFEPSAALEHCRLPLHALAEIGNAVRFAAESLVLHIYRHGANEVTFPAQRIGQLRQYLQEARSVADLATNAFRFTVQGFGSFGFTTVRI